MSTPVSATTVAAAVSVLLAVGSLPAGAAQVTPPPFPDSLTSKPTGAHVLARATLDDEGTVADVTVLYNAADPSFGNAATAALRIATFDAGAASPTFWFQFRFMEETLVTDVSEITPGNLDAEPELVTFVKPVFPPGAPSLRTEVPLNLFVGVDGKVWYAEVPDDGVSALYEERVLAAARQFEFKPVTRKGKPTAFWYPFVIDFD